MKVENLPSSFSSMTDLKFILEAWERAVAEKKCLWKCSKFGQRAEKNPRIMNNNVHIFFSLRKTKKEKKANSQTKSAATTTAKNKQMKKILLCSFLLCHYAVTRYAVTRFTNNQNDLFFCEDLGLFSLMKTFQF